MKCLYLYRVEVNAMYIYYVEDINTNKVICVDWDLDNEAEHELITQFIENKLEYTANGGEWHEPTDEYINNAYLKKIIIAKLVFTN